ncbi:hypothetical protein SISNIDRAFT_439915 [Sistotremastrum niveocremeum HHB9708]|uniref:RING-type E3 ubiquitin transferase n=2 Tax=Sistotremastraceae TaxID=3402574 RepID=A0A164VSD4_9AGAM|nr:hypothetical protein SISNIDRAFT_439915 [Sistotremastrum niveocremeum HHB9708]KZT43086.1 hypothetical protein SISSUDRAFT_1014528 [Sistotremastrum suecicum HHB10207 ss-3]
MFHRPPTSRPRGICVYYNTPRGCFAGNNCKFLHGNVQEISPYDQNKICRYYEAGYCKRGDQCWFRHATPQMPQLHESDDEELGCSICMEKPTVFGLLTGCSHVFCLSCLKKWRDPTGRSSEYLDSNSGMHKRCPMCRGPSRFVTPSHVFYKNEDPKKEEVLENYKKSMKRVKCKYFERSIPGLRFCPYGRDCFYKHEDENGQEYVFQKGVDHYMNVSGTRTTSFVSGNDAHPPDLQASYAEESSPTSRGILYWPRRSSARNADACSIADD